METKRRLVSFSCVRTIEGRTVEVRRTPAGTQVLVDGKPAIPNDLVSRLKARPGLLFALGK